MSDDIASDTVFTSALISSGALDSSCFSASCAFEKSSFSCAGSLLWANESLLPRVSSNPCACEQNLSLPEPLKLGAVVSAEPPPELVSPAPELAAGACEPELPELAAGAVRLPPSSPHAAREHTTAAANR